MIGAWRDIVERTGEAFFVQTEFVLLFLAFAATVASNWLDFRGTDKRKKTVAFALTLLAALILAINAIATAAKSYEIANLRLDSIERTDEASGGTVLGDQAYVVDDEEPDVFVFEMAEQGLKLKETIRLTNLEALARAFPCEIESKKSPTKTDCLSKNPEAKDLVTDFEGAASSGDYLYLSTSMGLTKNLKVDSRRHWFLEVEAMGRSRGRINRAAALSGAIREFLTQSGVPNIEQLQVEGLAVLPREPGKGARAFLGLRAPVAADGTAIVIESDIESILSKSPAFRLHRLKLTFETERGFENHSIVSMEADESQKRILLLSNLPAGNENSVPLIWSWVPGEVSEPELSVVRGPSAVPFKLSQNKGRRLEVLMPFRDRVHLLLDADGWGGQKSIPNARLGLP